MTSFFNNKWISAFLGTVLFRYAAFTFLFDSYSIKGSQIAFLDIGKFCSFDCVFIAKLVEDFKPSAFFPLFPGIARVLIYPLVQPLAALPAEMSVVLLSWIMTLLMGPLFLLLGEAYQERSGSQSTDRLWGWSKFSWLFLILLSISPHSHFWCKGYQESLFVPLLTITLIGTLKERWFIAAMATGLLAVTRGQGLWCVGIYFVYRLFTIWKVHQFKLVPLALELLLLIAPFFGLLWWNDVVTGDPWTFIQEHRKWGRGFSLYYGLWAHLPKFEDSHLFLYFSITVSVIFFKRWRSAGASSYLFLALITFAMAEIPLFLGGNMPLFGYTRFVGINLGIFLFLTEFLLRRPKFIPWFLIWFVCRLAIQTYHFTFNIWSG